MLIPGFHAWFHLHYFVRDMNNTNSHISRLWMALTLQEVIHSGLQETAQLCLRQPYVRKPGNKCPSEALELMQRLSHIAIDGKVKANAVS